MPVALEDDYTPDIAEALDDAREIIAPGTRAFMLAQREPSAPGLDAITLGSDPNGELLSGWCPVFSPLRDHLQLDLCEIGDVTRRSIERFFGLAVMEAGESEARVYKVARLIAAPTSPVARRWRFGLERTERPFTPLAPASGAWAGYPSGLLLGLTRA